MARLIRDSDADLSVLSGRTVAVLGYGNQGRSQALNMRDSGLTVIVGSQNDRSAEQARTDGFPVYEIKEASRRGSVLFLLLPDEVIPNVYNDCIATNLEVGDVITFASGFCVAFGLLTLPSSTDVVLLAPRMIGKGVRETFENGEGFPSLVGVAQDYSGQAWEITKALARAIGSTKMGALVSSFKEEALVDMFSEQSGGLYLFRLMFEALVEAGVDPDVAILEMYGSGELAEMYRAVRDDGLFGQLRLHSRTSQYGQTVAGPRNLPGDLVKASMRQVLDNIASGRFAAEWMEEERSGSRRLADAIDEHLNHPLQRAETSLYQRLGRRTEHISNWVREQATATE